MQKNGDDLELQISASVKKAEKSIDSLVAKLDVLQTSLTGVSAGGASKAADAFAEMSKQSRAAGKASKTFNSGMEKTNSAMQKTQKSAWSLASAFGKFYASYFMVIRGIKGLWRSIESTTDYIEAFNYFDVAFGKISSEWSQDFERFGYENAEAYADSFTKRMTDSLGDLSGLTLDADKGLLTASGTKNLALNIQEITQSASQLASITNSIGLVGEVSLTTADSFTKLAADMSSLFNIDFSSAMKNLQSGLIGQSRALYKYGIDITNATLQTYAYELGLSKAVSEMTQSEKMQLRMLAILDQSKVAWGDLANTINSPSNMIRQFSNNLKEAGMVLGQLFIPMLQKILPVLNGITIAIKNLLVNIASFFGVQLDLSSFGQGYADMEDGIDGVTDSLEDATAAAKKLKTATLGIDELNINAPQEDSGTSGGGVGGGVDLTDQILKATEEYQKIWDAAFAQMKNKAQKFADKFEKFLQPVKKLFEDIAIGDWFSVGQDTSNIISSIFDLFSRAIRSVDWELIGTNIGEFLKGINWTKIFDSVGNFLEKAIDSAIDLWAASFDAEPIATVIVTALGVAKFTGVGTAISNAITTSIGSSGISLSLPISLAITSLAIEYKTGKEKAELEEFIAKYGEEEGRVRAGTGVFDKAALYRYDTENADAAINQIYVEKIIELSEKAIGKLKEFGDFWNNNIAPWFTVEKWAELGANIGIGIAESWTNFKEDFSEKISDWYSDVEDWFDEKKWEFEGIKDGLESAFNSAIDVVKGIWNKFANWLNDKLVWEIEPVTAFGTTIFEGMKIDLGKLPTFQTGGFPEDGLFMANHNELVGQFSNGRTAVANNEQIVAGIKEGVREAVSEILAPYLADIAQNTRETADKEWAIGDREIARANARGQRSMGFALITE